MPETLTPKPNTCTNCPPLAVPRRGYTPARPSCIECVEKHLGAAYVLPAEMNDLSDLRRVEAPNLSCRLRAIGHFFEAEDESQEWPETARRHPGGAPCAPCRWRRARLGIAGHVSGCGASSSRQVCP